MFNIFGEIIKSHSASIKLERHQMNPFRWHLEGVSRFKLLNCKTINDCDFKILFNRKRFASSFEPDAVLALSGLSVNVFGASAASVVLNKRKVLSNEKRRIVISSTFSMSTRLAAKSVRFCGCHVKRGVVHVYGRC